MPAYRSESYERRRQSSPPAESSDCPYIVPNMFTHHNPGFILFPRNERYSNRRAVSEAPETSKKRKLPHDFEQALAVNESPPAPRVKVEPDMDCISSPGQTSSTLRRNPPTVELVPKVTYSSDRVYPMRVLRKLKLHSNSDVGSPCLPSVSPSQITQYLHMLKYSKTKPALNYSHSVVPVSIFSDSIAHRKARESEHTKTARDSKLDTARQAGRRSAKSCDTLGEATLSVKKPRKSAPALPKELIFKMETGIPKVKRQTANQL
ncbi:hypothetical protein BDN70DRAFT_937254 [Pholiota conissans]|uniref:Uncharacterized protein n=1 Tax=Pholiota conissans TaxID=109636 RepID=A0A9P5YR93_9AGAR|nr:hypothetical protein BDN70DRAFT_937254 [Pholiota conissans]